MRLTLYLAQLANKQLARPIQKESIRQLMLRRFVSLRAKIVVQLVLAKVSYLGSYLLCNIKLPKQAGPSTARAWSLVIKIVTASYSQIVRCILMIQKIPAKLPSLTSFQGYKFMQLSSYRSKFHVATQAKQFIVYCTYIRFIVYTLIHSDVLQINIF